MDQAKTEEYHQQFKRKRSKNIQNVGQKEAVWDLFKTGKLDPRALP